MKLNIGPNIRKYRKEKGMTQEQLAEYLGVSSQAVSRWESGTTYPDLELIPVLSNLFGVSIDVLFDLKEHQKEQAAMEALTELAKLSYEKEPNAEKAIKLIRDIRQNYIGCQCFWNFWISVNRRIYRHEAILPEVRLTFEAIMAGNYHMYKKINAIDWFSQIEDEEHIESFLNEYATETDMSKKTLLYTRYRALGQTKKADIYRQDILYNHIDQLVGNSKLWLQKEEPYDPMQAKASTEMCIRLLHDFCMCIPDENHPISGNGEMDLWVEPRLWMGMHAAGFAAYSGEHEKAFLILEDTISLLEKTMAIRKADLSANSPWLADIVWTAEEDYSHFGGSFLLETDEERCMYIHSREGACYVIYPSLYYNLLTASADERWYTRFCYCFDSIRHDPRYIGYVERAKALIHMRDKE